MRTYSLSGRDGVSVVYRGLVVELPLTGEPGDLYSVATEFGVRLFGWQDEWVDFGDITGPPGVGIQVQGEVSDPSQLPVEGNEPGDVYFIDGFLWAWYGQWVDTGINLTGPQGEQGIQGDRGEVGPRGADGTGVSVIGSLDDPSQLPSDGNIPGDAYLITGNLWVWSGTEWVDAGNIQGPQGEEGPSAYEVAVDNGFTGSESEWLVSLIGPEGFSAYEVAVDEGFVGSEADWLASLVGPEGPASTVPGPPGQDSTVPGPQGEEGPSAYEVAVANGFVGSETAWLASLRGDDGTGVSIIGTVDDPSELPTEDNIPGDAFMIGGSLWVWSGTEWVDAGNIEGPQGEDGRSAYEVAVAGGFSGSEADWLASLVGPPGADGEQGPPGEDSTVPGPDGLSAYEVAVAAGFVGSEAEWLESLVGPEGEQGPPGADSTVPGPPGQDSAVPGPEGPSAYEVAVANGFVGSEAAWLESLVGPEGEQGPPGADSTIPGPPGQDSTVPGPQGDDGPSAYEVAVANGFTGSEAAWLESLVGPPGADGEQGPPGADSTVPGPPGEQGIRGPAGPGLPTGGTEGQIPIKSSAADYDIEWGEAPQGFDPLTYSPVVIGDGATIGTGSNLHHRTAVGTTAQAIANHSSAFGRNAQAIGSDSSAFGRNAVANDSDPLRIKYGESRTLNYSTNEEALWSATDSTIFPGTGTRRYHPHSEEIIRMKALDQAEYDAIAEKDPATLYVITGGVTEVFATREYVDARVPIIITGRVGGMVGSVDTWSNQPAIIPTGVRTGVGAYSYTLPAGYIWEGVSAMGAGSNIRMEVAVSGTGSPTINLISEQIDYATGERMAQDYTINLVAGIRPV